MSSIEDVRRVQRAAENLGHKISFVEAERLWQIHSDNSAANWLTLPSDIEELENEIRGWF